MSNANPASPSHLILDLRIAGRLFPACRVHGAGGLLPARGGLERLRHRMAKGDTIRVYTAWSATGDVSVDVPAAQLEVVS